MRIVHSRVAIAGRVDAARERRLARVADVAHGIEVRPAAGARPQPVAQVVDGGRPAAAGAVALQVERRVQPLDLDVADRAEARSPLGRARCRAGQRAVAPGAVALAPVSQVAPRLTALDSSKLAAVSPLARIDSSELKCSAVRPTLGARTHVNFVPARLVPWRDGESLEAGRKLVSPNELVGHRRMRAPGRRSPGRTTNSDPRNCRGGGDTEQRGSPPIRQRVE